MQNDNQDEVIVNDVEENNEEVVETTEEPAKAEKPKRTPQEELEYFEGRAARLRKKLGTESKDESTVIESKSTQNGKLNELTDGQIAILRTEGIKSKAELALFKEVMSETGKGVLDLLDSSYFNSRLTEFRSAQESINAIPKGKNRSGQQGVTDDDVAFAKFNETGQMPTDLKGRIAIKNKLIANEASKMFDGPSVIGPSGNIF